MADVPAPTVHAKARPATELASHRLFRPLAEQLVAPLARTGVRPTQVVVVHTLLGLLAAWQIRRGQRLAPALLLQLKTTLDGLDGQLARATGQTTETGRYLDTELDVVVNAAVLVALLGRRRGLAATLLLSLILTTDYLWERDYREARGEVFRAGAAQAGDDPRLLALLQAVYAGYFAPQERLLGALFAWRLERVAGPDPAPAVRQAYAARLPVAVTANLGLATQLLLAGLAVAAGRGRLWPASFGAQVLLLLLVQGWRERQARAVARQDQAAGLR
jgi:archaetidylinositol phosphate synthase